MQTSTSWGMGALTLGKIHDTPRSPYDDAVSPETSVDPAAARDKTWGWVPWWGTTLFLYTPRGIISKMKKEKEGLCC